MQYRICMEFVELHAMKMEQMIHHNEIYIFMLECCKIYAFLLYASLFFIRFRIPGLNYIYSLWCVKVIKLAWYTHTHFPFLQNGMGQRKRRNLWLNVEPTTLFIAVFWTLFRFILFSFQMRLTCSFRV